MEVHLTRVDLVVVGSLSSDLARVADDYERRLGRYVRLEVHEAKNQLRGARPWCCAPRTSA